MIRRGILVVAAIVAATLVPVLPAAADNTGTPLPDFSASLFTTWLGGQQAQEGAWNPGNSVAKEVFFSPDSLTVFVNGGSDPGQPGFSLDLRPFNAPRLRTGEFTAATIDALLTLGSIGTTLNEVHIWDVGYDAAGVPNRLDMTFIENPSAAANTIFGSIRFGEPAAAAGALSAARTVWPVEAIGTTPVHTTQWVENTSGHAEHVDSLAVAGPAAAAFTLSSDTCSGTTLAPGADCSAVVSFAPRAAGASIATLDVPIGGTVLSASLAGVAPGGVTSFITSGDGYVGFGQRRVYADGPYQLVGAALPDGTLAFSSTHVYSDDDNHRVALRIAAPTGQSFTLGRHQLASTRPADGYTLNIVRDNQFDCGYYAGWINIRSLALASNGAPLSADITMTYQCVHGSADYPSDTGELRWRDRATPTVLPSMHTMHTGYLLSATRRYQARISGTGQLVVADQTGRPLWSLHAGTHPGASLAMRRNGDLVLYTSSHHTLWHTHTDGHPGAVLKLSNDGRLRVVTSHGTIQWRSPRV